MPLDIATTRLLLLQNINLGETDQFVTSLNRLAAKPSKLASVICWGTEVFETLARQTETIHGRELIDKFFQSIAFKPHRFVVKEITLPAPSYSLGLNKSGQSNLHRLKMRRAWQKRANTAKRKIEIYTEDYNKMCAQIIAKLVKNQDLLVYCLSNKEIAKVIYSMVLKSEAAFNSLIKARINFHNSLSSLAYIDDTSFGIYIASLFARPKLLEKALLVKDAAGYTQFHYICYFNPGRATALVRELQRKNPKLLHKLMSIHGEQQNSPLATAIMMSSALSCTMIDVCSNLTARELNNRLISTSGNRTALGLAIDADVVSVPLIRKIIATVKPHSRVAAKVLGDLTQSRSLYSVDDAHNNFADVVTDVYVALKEVGQHQDLLSFKRLNNTPAVFAMISSPAFYAFIDEVAKDKNDLAILLNQVDPAGCDLFKRVIRANPQLAIHIWKAAYQNGMHLSLAEHKTGYGHNGFSFAVQLSRQVAVQMLSDLPQAEVERLAQEKNSVGVNALDVSKYKDRNLYNSIREKILQERPDKKVRVDEEPAEEADQTVPTAPQLQLTAQPVVSQEPPAVVPQYHGQPTHNASTSSQPSGAHTQLDNCGTKRKFGE